MTSPINAKLRNIKLNRPGTKKIRTGDRVIAITGSNRGQIGVVQKCVGDKVVVQGLNIVKKHMKKTQTAPGGIVEMEKPIHVSNVKLCVDENTAVKLKVRKDDQGQSQLVYKQGDQEVVYRSVKTPK